MNLFVGIKNCLKVAKVIALKNPHFVLSMIRKMGKGICNKSQICILLLMGKIACLINVLLAYALMKVQSFLKKRKA